VGILASGPAGWAFAATTTAAAILAGAYGYMKAARRNLENALAHLQTSLAQIAQRSFAAVEGSINDLDAQMVRQANESFQKMADETQKELKIRLNEIQKARKRTRMEARQAVAQIMPKLKQMKNLDGELKRITENLQGAMA
jgi:predicted enzyme involved in methoxymalonyl-ACP biosynthesis